MVKTTKFDNCQFEIRKLIKRACSPKRVELVDFEDLKMELQTVNQNYRVLEKVRKDEQEAYEKLKLREEEKSNQLKFAKLTIGMLQ